MAADEIVKLKVTTEGDQAALQSLTKLDQLIAKINKEAANVKVTSSGTAEVLNELMSIAELIRQINQTPVNVAASGLSEMENAAQKAAEAASQYVEASTAIVPAYTEALKIGDQVVLCEQEILGAAQNRASAYDKAAEAAERIIDVDYTIVEEENKATDAVEESNKARKKAADSQEKLKEGYSKIGAIIVRSVTQNIKKATDELKAMNAEMVSIQKVTGATDADMERLKDSAFEVAGALGAKPSEYLASVTKWAQAGYRALSDQLGELSAKTQVVGDVNEETANKFLLAVDAAYKYKGNIDSLTRVLDGANEISNNYATSVEKLAGGMGIVSSLAEQAGMKVEETMAAIGTITAKTQESGNSAARALRALILNIQGSTEIEIDAETGERWTEDEIQRTAAALGDLNVATREYKNGILELRNPMEVIGELAEKYQKGLVTEAQLQEVVASLGGKVRSNQLMALIQGYETYTGMIETYKDALGSADKELEIYLNGWEAKSNKLVAQWTEFVESFKTSDISMTALDLASALLDIANTPAGKILTVAAAMAALNAAMKTDKGVAILGALNAVPKEIGKIVEAAKGGTEGLVGLRAAWKGAQAGAGAFVKTLSSALGPVGLTVAGITVLAAIIDVATVSAEEQAEKTADAVAEYEKEKATLEGLEDQLKTTQDRIDELNGKGGRLTVVEQEELDRLEEENRRLERQIILQKDLAEAKKRAAEAETNKSLNKGYTGANYNYQPWRDNVTGTPSITKGNIEYELGQRSGFEGQANYLMGLLDQLEEKKRKFLADNGNQKGWTTQTVKDFEAIETEIQTAKDISIGFYNELDGLIQNLPEGANKELWEGIQDALWVAMYPAEALTEKLNRLVGAMDEAEKTRFDEALKGIQADGEVTAQEVQTLIDKFPALKVLLEGNAGALDTLAQYFTEATAKTEENTTATEENANAAETEAEEWDEVAAKLKKYANQASGVKDAQEELRKNGELSFDTLVGLLGKYGNAVNDVVIRYMNGQATQEEMFKALEIAYEKDVQHYREAMLEKEMDNEDFYASWLAGNADTVKTLLTQYGIDATNYKTFAGLKEAIENGTQKDLTAIEQGGANDRAKIFQSIQTAFSNAQDAMVTRAQSATGAISRMYGALAEMMGGVANSLSSWAQRLSDPVLQKVNELKQGQQEKALQEIMNTLSEPAYSGSSGSKGSSASGKDWYETQTGNLKKLEETTKRTNQVLERSDEDTAQKRIDNLKKVQEQILAVQKQFIAKGKAETSDEVNQLKLMYAGLGDDIESIYSSMTDAVLEQHERLMWEFDLKANDPRAMEQIAKDDAAMVEQYRNMQEDVHKLAEYYRSQGVRENSKLIQDLQDKWWEYEKSIRSMYDNLTDAFNDYIDESSHKIEELGRTTGNVGKQIEIYAQRIQKAQETIAALQSQNIAGALNGDIHDLESQIWGDKDAIRDLQEGLWDELERAFDDIFDKAQEDIDAIGDEIDDIQDQMDDINDILARYDKELEGILKPINEALEKLNDQLEAERKRLEALTDPLNDRRQQLEDQIKGYYTLNPDGSIGPYIKGLDDDIGAIQDQLDKANEELDRVNDAWNEQKDREEEALALQKKQLAVEEAQKAVEEALLALQTARNERNVYTLKDGVWAWRADEEAVAKAEKALAEAEKAKEEAEKDLQDYKEEQAHNQIVKRLEEQIKALEEQKKLLDKQKDLINKQIDAISKQISAYEKESRARQDYIQNLIDQKEAEKKAWEDHYEALKEQYSGQLEALEAEKKAAEERKKLAEQQYDDWMDTWKDIQKSIETPARDLSEILNDIAKYGTPAMASQVDRVTELLRDLGYAIEDVTNSGGYEPGDDWGGGAEEGMSRREIIDRMLENHLRAKQTTDRDELLRLQQDNEWLGAMIGAKKDYSSGQWDIFDYSGGTVTVRPGAYSDSWNGGYIGQPLTAYRLGDDDGWETTKALNGIISSSDYTASRAAASYATYSTAGDTVYNNDHSVTINGMKVGSDTVNYPLSQILNLVGLNMGT